MIRDMIRRLERVRHSRPLRIPNGHGLTDMPHMDTHGIFVPPGGTSFREKKSLVASHTVSTGGSWFRAVCSRGFHIVAGVVTVTASI
jgi:hypothetical protein